MSSRGDKALALIVAIEDYPQAIGVAKHLPGTLQAGLDFRAWVESKWAAEQRDPMDMEILFCSEPRQTGERGASQDDLRECLLRLKKNAGSVDELFVFFSGHGFSFVDGSSRADIMITSNFTDADHGSSASINLDWMINWLFTSLQNGHHYYFVDACRNEMNGTQVAVHGSLLPDSTGGGSSATFYSLQSTVQGRFAAVGDRFPRALMDGLAGKGKAKVWDDAVSDAMLVRFDSLRRFVTERLQSGQPISNQLKGTDGESEAVLATLRPVPTVDLSIQIDGGTDAPGTVRMRRGRAAYGEELSFATWPQTIMLEPDAYEVDVQLEHGVVEGSNPLQLELYDDFEHKLRLRSPGIPTRSLPAGSTGPVVEESIELPVSATIESTVRIDVVVPPGSRYKLRNIDTGELHQVEVTRQLQVSPGRYAASLRLRNDALVHRRDLDLSDRAEPVRLNAWKDSIPASAIAEALPLTSKSLGGPDIDPDLDVLLALLGGDRILSGKRGRTVRDLPLHDFRRERRGASPIYVLAGLEDQHSELEARIEGSASGWQAMQRTAIDGVREAYLPADVGSQLISLRLGRKNTYTVASVAMPFRATLVTVSLGVELGWNISQFSLPLGQQIGLLPARVTQSLALDAFPLKKLRFLAQAQRSFRSRHDLRMEFNDEYLQDLLNAKWLDPIGSALAGYELIRRDRKSQLLRVVANMRKFFPELPDTAALERMSGRNKRVPPPSGPPLFQDGMRAWPEFQLPLPESHLDFNSLWTAWRMAAR